MIKVIENLRESDCKKEILFYIEQLQDILNELKEFVEQEDVVNE